MIEREIIFANRDRCMAVASAMNENFIVLEDNCTFGTSYYKWEFAKGSTILRFTHGEGRVGGRFTRHFLVRGTAYKVGRGSNSNRDYFGESVTVR